jgi:hypothetical protein
MKRLYEIIDGELVMYPGRCKKCLEPLMKIKHTCCSTEVTKRWKAILKTEEIKKNEKDTNSIY